jgi:hypothetical protein
LGAVVYWGPLNGPQHLEHIRIAPGPAGPAVRHRLIRESVRSLGSKGFRTVYVLVLAPPLSAGRARRWMVALTRLHFHLRTRGYRYEWRSNRGLPRSTGRLRFVSIEEAGDRAGATPMCAFGRGAWTHRTSLRSVLLHPTQRNGGVSHMTPPEVSLGWSNRVRMRAALRSNGLAWFLSDGVTAISTNCSRVGWPYCLRRERIRHEPTRISETGHCNGLCAKRL